MLDNVIITISKLDSYKNKKLIICHIKFLQFIKYTCYHKLFPKHISQHYLYTLHKTLLLDEKKKIL